MAREGCPVGAPLLRDDPGRPDLRPAQSLSPCAEFVQNDTEQPAWLGRPETALFRAKGATGSLGWAQARIQAAARA